jgi:putative ABC transport system permease protein
MPLSETIRIALRSIRANKMRSILTMLGIIIGVASVIALSAVGHGATKQVTQKVEGLGANLLTVSPGADRRGGISFGPGSANALTYSYASIIAEQDPDVASVAPMQQTNAQVVYAQNNTSTSIQGTTANYTQIRSTPMEEGRFLLPQDVVHSSHVAVLGYQTAQTLFAGTGVSPIGQSININNIPFDVIGVMASQGSNGFQNMDDRVIIPITTEMHVLTGKDSVNNISISAASPTVMDQVQQEVEATLRNLNHLGPGQSDNFRIQNQASILSTLSSVTNTLTMLLGGVAAISLIVGGIGIMNIMLVSVTERTREIGIRKAIGAKRGVILTQFLVEAIMLSIGGALIGVILGAGGSELIGQILKLGNLVSLTSVLLAVGSAMTMGIVFGVYPARKASMLSPIDALRYE